ncbi:hypothetical protein [Duganella flavida]|uniref:hypothetical protein n=1 Tax=Duganella flavida TaxID=2692175 RepID=UPI001E5625CA|nr:hypothetical protein [Duganella flavida]
MNDLALAHAAAHRAALLLERYRHGDAEGASVQTAWHDAQQAHFLGWLEAGGFTKENSGTQPLFSVPQRNLYEESKFSLLRINDAAE